MNPLPQSIKQAAEAAATATQWVGPLQHDGFWKGLEWLYSFLISRGDEFDEAAFNAWRWQDEGGNPRQVSDVEIARWQHSQSLAEKAALRAQLQDWKICAETEGRDAEHLRECVFNLNCEKADQLREITRLRETIAFIKTQPNLAQVKILCDSALERK